MGSYGLPIGNRWPINRRDVDPDSWISLRTRMEAIQGNFEQGKDEGRVVRGGASTLVPFWRQYLRRIAAMLHLR
jgi:hypothetical protein